jgi:hypothetical protein
MKTAQKRAEAEAATKAHEAAKAERSKHPHPTDPDATEESKRAWARADVAATAHGARAAVLWAEVRAAEETETETQETGDETVQTETQETKTKTTHREVTERLPEGTPVVHRGERQTVAGYSRGWYELANGAKARAGALLEIVEEESDDEANSTRMSKTLDRYKPQYKETVAYSGAKSQNNGDGIAEILAGLTPEAVCHTAERLLGLENGELVAKYQHLNPGQQRMNSGNRIRAALKRGDATIDEVKKAAKAG